MIHLTIQQLSAYLDGELPEASAELVRRHLSQCPECTERFAGIEAQEEILDRLLRHDPGDAFFEGFAASLGFAEPARSRKKKSPPRKPAAVPAAPESRAESRAEGRAEAPSKPRRDDVRDEPVTPPESSPSPLSEESPAVLSPSGGGVTTTETPVHPLVLYGRMEEGRAPQRTPAGAATAWMAAAALVAALSSVAVVTWRGGAGAIPAAAGRQAAAETGRGRTAPTPEDLLEEIGVAEFTPPSRAVALEQAAKATTNAAQAKSAAAFDAAAASWERALPDLAGAPDDLARARRELARARFQAWDIDPSPLRRERAVSAICDYFAHSRPGADRNQAWAWLGRLKS